jgi:DNA repair exonuclease SbcCD ATPase subunit
MCKKSPWRSSPKYIQTIIRIRNNLSPIKRSNVMARKKPSDQVAALRKQQAELEARLREAQTRANAEAKEKQRRKNELAGAVALKEFEANPSGDFALALRELLHAGVTRAADRAEFALDPLPRATKAVAG